MTRQLASSLAALVVLCLVGASLAGAQSAANVDLVGALDTPGAAQGVALGTAGSAAYAYVADGQAGLQVVDLTDRARPRQVGTLPAPNSCPATGAHPDCGPAFVVDVAVAGSHLYRTDAKRQYCTNQGCIANPESGLRVFDVSSPASPREVGFLHTPGEAQRVALAGRYAYLADGSGGLRVIDADQPTGDRGRLPLPAGLRARTARAQHRQPGRAGRGRLLRHARHGHPGDGRRRRAARRRRRRRTADPQVQGGRRRRAEPGLPAGRPEERRLVIAGPG
jgi:hypothetical protein